MKMSALLLYSALTVPAMAQPPELIRPEGQIEVAIGESKTYRFGESFQSASMSSKDIAEITPQSDRSLTIAGLNPGQTLLYLRDDKGNTFYTAAITVTPSTGHLVKVYRRDVKDFIGFYCSETGCGRADLDKKLANGGRDPDEPVAQSTTVTRPLDGGGAISTTRQYRP